MPGCNGSDRRQRAPPERGADFRVVWDGENVCRIPSTGGMQVMRSVSADSAASPGGSRWDQIDWATAHYRVRRLQTRIAKATRARDHRVPVP